MDTKLMLNRRNFITTGMLAAAALASGVSFAEEPKEDLITSSNILNINGVGISFIKDVTIVTYNAERSFAVVKNGSIFFSKGKDKIKTDIIPTTDGSKTVYTYENVQIVIDTANNNYIRIGIIQRGKFHEFVSLDY